MLVWLLDAIMILTGLAHAIASWIYFARLPHERWWLWSLSWILATVACMFAAHWYPFWGYGLFAGAVIVWTVWWVAIKPSAVLTWVPENRYQATAKIVADTLMVRYVRNFDWTGKRKFTETWEDRSYDLTKLKALDLFVCTWGSAHVAHIMLSFDFEDCPPLCFSIETRREAGEQWTALAGLMKSFELFVLAGDERDLVRSRVNIRGEDVRLYRVYSTPAMRRKILDGMLAQMNRIATRPLFYNTIFHNCTIEIARIVWAAGHRFPFDWRILVSGHVAEYLYDLRLLDQAETFADLKAKADIRARSLAADADPDYSRRIRVGLADPNPA